MAIARVVTFDDVDASRMTDLQQRMEQGDRPDGMPPVEVIVLHDTDERRAMVVQLFANEDDYRRGEAIFAAMPADDTPGRRAAVSRYAVAARMQG